MQLRILDINSSFKGIEETIYPVILNDENNLVLIDCGYTGFLTVIEKSISDIGLDMRSMTHIIITHQDHDHMGALSEIKQKYPNVKVIAGKDEAAYISGKEKFLRLKQAEEMLAVLPQEKKDFGIAFCNMLRAVKPVDVDIEAEDDDILDLCGGLTIVGTPGHTPGHIGVYVHETKSLIAGDAAALENGELVIANPQFTLDIIKANDSLNKLKSYGAKEIICYHGGLYTP